MAELVEYRSRRSRSRNGDEVLDDGSEGAQTGMGGKE